MNSGRSGLGPTKLMLPFRTLRICGNSSKRVSRIKLPTRVILLSVFSAHLAPFFSVSVRMPRNLCTLKACLVCLLWFGYRKTGAAMSSSSQMAITVSMRKGDATNKMTKLTRISNVLFMASWKRDCLNPLDVTSHAGWMISIRIWPVFLSKKDKITMVSTPFHLQLTSSAQ